MSAQSTSAPAKPKKINLRTPDVMAKVQEQVELHYRSVVVERIRSNGGILSVHDTTVRLAKQFGFCYGVERAIDLAYAARKVFSESRLFILGEIIHNPLVNEQIAAMGIKNLLGNGRSSPNSFSGVICSVFDRPSSSNRSSHSRRDVGPR